MAAAPKEMRWGEAGLDPGTLGTRGALRGTALPMGLDRQKGPGGRGGSPCEVTYSKQTSRGRICGFKRMKPPFLFLSKAVESHR